MKYPSPNGYFHNLIRDRARYLRKYLHFDPPTAFAAALQEFNKGRLENTFVQPKLGRPYTPRNNAYHHHQLTLESNHDD